MLSSLFPSLKKGKLQPHQKRNAEREGEKNKNSWNPEGGSNQTVQMPTIMEPHNQQQQEENNSFTAAVAEREEEEEKEKFKQQEEQKYSQ